MCLNYIHYFPRAEELEICKSAVDEKALDQYFQNLNEWEDQPTDIEDGNRNATRNYHAIDWTLKRSSELLEFYSEAPVSMQCQSGNGDKLTGDWTNLKPSKIKQTLSSSETQACHNVTKGGSNVIAYDVNAESEAASEDDSLNELAPETERNKTAESVLFK
jgi:hypothetical protein